MHSGQRWGRRLAVLGALGVALAVWRNRMLAINERKSPVPPKEPTR